jgi:hypothetical protein
MYEQVFKNKSLKENNWDFDYIVIKDLNEKIIFATFLTTTVQKDDIFSISDISKLIEKERVSDPYYLVSKVLSIGCGLSIGEQVFVDDSHPLWTDAVNLFLNEVEMLKEKRKVDKIMLRDFNIANESFKNLIEEKGYFSMDLPQNNIIEETSLNESDFLKSLNSNRRRHYKKQIKIENSNFVTKVATIQTSDQIEHIYNLYLNVWSKNKDLNTFALPIEFFESIAKHSDWEITEVYEKNSLANLSVAVIFTHVSEKSISPLILGASSNINENSNVYRFVLETVLQQSFNPKLDKVFLGITNANEKRKIGAKQQVMKGYFQVSDHYNDSVISTYSKQPKTMKS